MRQTRKLWPCLCLLRKRQLKSEWRSAGRVWGTGESGLSEIYSVENYISGTERLTFARDERREVKYLLGTTTTAARADVILFLEAA